MSAALNRTNQFLTTVSAQNSAASSHASDSSEKKPSKEVVENFMGLHCSSAATKEYIEFVPQNKCLKTAEMSAPGLWVTMLPSLVSAVLVVIGWFVVHKAQSNRERRKQIREYIGDLCDRLNELEVLVIGYHTAERDEVKEQEIISKLGRLEKAYSMLPRFVESQKFLFRAVNPEKLKVNGKCMQVLRKAMTLNHFGDEHTEAKSRGDDHIMDLETAAENMRDVFECVRIAALD